MKISRRETLELHTLGVRSRLHPGRRHELRQCAHRLDLDPSGRAGATAANSFSTNACMSLASRSCSARAIPIPASIRAAQCSADLARHPATAQHIAEKLARHFVADEPPPALVGQARQILQRQRRQPQRRRQNPDRGRRSPGRRSGKSSRRPRSGSRPCSVSPARSQYLRSAGDERASHARRAVVAAARRRTAFPTPKRPGSTACPTASISPTPSPDACRGADPLALLESGLGPLASPDTRQTVARAESRSQALALLVMAPEFLRR